MSESVFPWLALSPSRRRAARLLKPTCAIAARALWEPTGLKPVEVFSRDFLLVEFHNSLKEGASIYFSRAYVVAFVGFALRRPSEWFGLNDKAQMDSLENPHDAAEFRIPLFSEHLVQADAV